MKPVFFAHAAAFRAWLHEHHATATELWVGYHRKSTGRATLTWQESVVEAIAFGWIDGIRRRIDDEAYTNRFTPRKPTSIWSDVNTRTAEALIAAGRMQPAGRRAFEARDASRAGVYSFERKNASLSRDELAAFRKRAKAWAFWQAQPAGYRRTAAHWVASAKRPETRARRFATLVRDAAAGLRIKPLRR